MTRGDTDMTAAGTTTMQGSNQSKQSGGELARIERCRSDREAYLGKFQGCLIGGAVGDALGYPVEFMSSQSIKDTFGPEGIRGYWLEETGGTALFSDDTQMTLFTAAGLLEGDARAKLQGIAGAPENYVNRAYLDWLHTQDRQYTDNPGASWLVAVDELYARRAPGNTCLSALYGGGGGSTRQPINDSKGCGGVMRVAPIGLFARTGVWFGGIQQDTPAALREVVRAGAEAAALTHGHPLGYIPAGVLAAIVALAAFRDDLTLEGIVELCVQELPSWFEGQRGAACDMASRLRRAMKLARGGESDHECVVRLGEGWVGDEALAIADFCCLRHPGSFDEAVIAAVNHGGDSDSTGAIAGNIMGAYLGIEAIGEQWTADLELRDLILEVARDLCDGCLMSEHGSFSDEWWLAKYARSSKESR